MAKDGALPASYKCALGWTSSREENVFAWTLFALPLKRFGTVLIVVLH